MKKFIKELLSWAAYLLSGVLIAFFIINFVFRFTVVHGDSMSSTLEDGNILYVDMLSYHIGELKRGDIVICNYPGKDKDLYFVKRIIGLPGDRIEIKNSVVYINGQENIDKWNGNHIIADMKERTIPSDCYFVMGDNRSNSSDSRDSSVGALSKDMLVGKVGFRILPFGSFGKIEYKY